MKEAVLGSLIIFGVMAAMAVLFLVLARKMAAGTLRPNAFVGIRTPATLRSADAWYAGHLAAAPQMVYSSRAFGVTAVGALVNAVMDGPKWVVGVLMIANSLLVLPLMVWAAVVAGRAAGPRVRR
ncbi:SdpI family protein [Frankia sp. AgB32]|uniref:SdpI family protein n=1 Tax=Frankia sp. AgB32 TaxID=631119 RepID=UPI00200DE8FD|nr:SdpI family protein [Frankia sp. AgB32]MCK9895809.1 SdpI family protein [Frankia sp. AgB32]